MREVLCNYKDNIEIIGASENNLKHIDLTIPKGKLVVLAGVSGSGKSSLAFDTIAVESARQWQTSYPLYLRNKMPHYERPKVDEIRSLSVTEDSYYSNGSLGTLKIPAIGLDVKIVQGTNSAALKKGVGHFEETSIWNGNIGLAAHNRGTNSYFGKIHTLETGDEITLSTKQGTRTYEVVSVAKVTETDRSSLENTSDNCLTLYTCVRDQRDLRWCVRAVEMTD